MADEDGEAAVRVFEHVYPALAAQRLLRTSRPAQTGQCRGRHDVENHASVHIVLVGILQGLLGGGNGCNFQHCTQHTVGPVGGDALQAVLPCFHVQIFEGLEWVVCRYIYCFADGGVHKGLHGGRHRHVVGSGHFQRGHEVFGQLVHIAAEVAIQAPGVIFDLDRFLAAVRHALVAVVEPGERRFDAIACIVSKGQADGAGRGNRQQVAVAQAMLPDACFDVFRQARSKARFGQILVNIERRESAFFDGQVDGCFIGKVTHGLRNAGCHRASFIAVVFQAEHDQCITQAGEAYSNAPLGLRLALLFLQRPDRCIQHVVQHARCQTHHEFKSSKVEVCFFGERVEYKPVQVDAAQIAAAVAGQRLLAARIGSLNLLYVGKIVVTIDLVNEEHTGFCMVIGCLHDLLPHVRSFDLAVYP